jgi:hypothetical protein
VSELSKPIDHWTYSLMCGQVNTITSNDVFNTTFFHHTVAKKLDEDVIGLANDIVCGVLLEWT